MASPLGYQALIERFRLKTLPLARSAVLDTSIKGRQWRQQGGEWIELFERNYLPEDTLAGHLQFAMRYEGVNLQVLTLLFNERGEKELMDWLRGSPSSRYARSACFLYEWLTNSRLPMEDPVSPRSRFVPIAHEHLQFVHAKGLRQSRFRVINNLPGNRDFSPYVRLTSYLRDMRDKDLRGLLSKTLAEYDQGLLRRAAAFLYLKETQSSFEVEREKPSPQKAQRFTDLLRQADTREALTEDRLVELQNSVVDARFHEFTWRHEQNWIGKDFGYRKKIDFVPARPEDLTALMQGLLEMANSFQQRDLAGSKVDPVVVAASLSFGFVYIHPFMDGNGRIHRYLVHDVLAKAEFTPRGIVLPVSAVILANLDEYIETLEQFSRPLNQLTEYDPDVPSAPANGNEFVYYRHPDLTSQAEFLYKALERTITHDLQEEIDFLLGFDRAAQALNALLDWPRHNLDLFIRVVKENEGRLSTNKRKSHFDWMTPEEIRQCEEVVRDAFGMQ